MTLKATELTALLKKNSIHLGVIIFFVAVSISYFSPILSGKKLYQADITNYIGMSKEIKDFKAKFGEEPYWTNSMFGGMPSYQISASYKYNWIRNIDKLFRFLPRPADYLFLYFISFYFMMLVLGYNWRVSLIGAMAFGLSTYFLIILEAGHNSKAHAIGYIPLVTAGIILAFRKKYLIGGIITAIFMALEISANHFQMTYYLGLLILLLSGFYLYEAIKEKKIIDFAKSIFILLFAVLIAFGTNASRLLSTYEYTKYSTRGPSELTIDKNKSQKTKGLDKDYITQWSYGILESMNLVIPNFMGGASGQALSMESNLAKKLKGRASKSQIKQFVSHAPTYWGEQPFVSGPAYVGAIVIFLFVLGLFIVKGKMKWWLLSGTVLSLILSWGKNFMPATDFMIDYFPMYDKFRAVASIQIILEFTIPFLAVLTLKKWFFDAENQKKMQKSLLYSLYIVGGTILFFILFGTYLFDFSSVIDGRFEKMGILDALINDRIDMFKSDGFRSLIFVIITTGVLFLFNKKKLSKNIAFALLILFIIIDLAGVDKRYLNNDKFVSKRKVEKPFAMTSADREILKDKSIYRVYNAAVSTMSNSSTSYFHQSIGGYHGAKLKRYQEIWDMQLSKHNQEVLNMLNTKYFIIPNEGKTQVSINPNANGNAWFVNKYTFVENADEEMLALNDFNSKTEAIVDKKFKNNFENKQLIPADSSSYIKLSYYQANKLIYESNNKEDGLAVFSEIYYPKGWYATIDGQETDISRANYILRTIWVPKGKHEIVFEFKPDVVYTGNKITLASNFILFGMLFLSIFIGIKKYFFSDLK